MRASAAIKQSYSREGAKALRVLYAEDQHSSRIVTTAMLQRMGYDVEAVEDGEMALIHAKAERFDLILLDIEMPVMDGVTAARIIRQGGTANDGVPILALSAFLADSTEQTQWRDAFDHALPKPASQEELKNAMDRAVALIAPVTKAVEAPSRETLRLSIKSALPKGAWVRLTEQVAREMRHLSNVISACLESGDPAQAGKCADVLATLAGNFGAANVKAQAHAVNAVPPEHSVERMEEAIALWCKVEAV